MLPTNVLVIDVVRDLLINDDSKNSSYIFKEHFWFYQGDCR